MPFGSGIWPLREYQDARLRSYFLPTAPTNVVGTAGNGQVSLTWTAASAISQIPVTDYVVQYSSNSGTTWTTFSDGTSASASATVTNLQNGTAYTFRVAAVNGVGQGAWSTASAAVTPNAATDPFFNNVSLLLHMDGSNGSTTFTDSSGSPKTITASGNAAQASEQSKFGGKSLYLNGGSDGLYTSDLLLGVGDFTIEMFFMTSGGVQYAQLIGNEASTFPYPGFSLLIDNNSASGGQIAFYRETLICSTPSGDYSDGQWHYLALVNSSGAVSLYLDGDRKATGTLSQSMNGGNWWIGRNNTFPPRNVAGYIDEVRVSTTARYSGQTITVPTAPFPDA